MSTHVCLDFECVECPPMCGVFSVHASVAEQEALSPENMPFRCPRGHAQTWMSYRCFLRLDEGGYPYTGDRASIVAFLRSRANSPHPIERGVPSLSPAGRGLLLLMADKIERGEHLEKP